MMGSHGGRALARAAAPGCKVQDTVALCFPNVRVPQSNRLGEEDYLGHAPARERISVAVGSVAQARSAIAATRQRRLATARHRVGEVVVSPR